MSIWGKVIGGAGGFMLGGPLGALIGAVGGHWMVDRRESSTDGFHEAGNGGADGQGWARQEKSVTFTIAVIVLGAKMAKSDGVVSHEEITAFKDVFRVPEHEMAHVGKVFNQAKKDPHGYEPYAHQLKQLFGDSPQVLEEILWSLSHIAKADGEIHPKELDFLHKIGDIFGIEARAFERITALSAGGEDGDPYRMLGVSPEASDSEVKSAWRRLARDYHPDRLTAQGVPEEIVKLSNDRLARINEAYDRIKSLRKVA